MCMCTIIAPINSDEHHVQFHHTIKTNEKWHNAKQKVHGTRQIVNHVNTLPHPTFFFLSEISSSQVSRSRKLVQSSSNPAGILATAIVHLWQATKAKKSLKLNLCWENLVSQRRNKCCFRPLRCCSIVIGKFAGTHDCESQSFLSARHAFVLVHGFISADVARCPQSFAPISPFLGSSPVSCTTPYFNIHVSLAIICRNDKKNKFPAINCQLHTSCSNAISVEIPNYTSYSSMTTEYERVMQTHHFYKERIRISVTFLARKKNVKHI